MNAKPKLIVIGGPTGVGKTSAAIRVAQHLGGQIVNADSMQIYRYMDIGTAKPSCAEQAAVKHHLLDVVDPDGHFDAQRFVDLALPVIHRNQRHNRPTIVAGGTGLYIKALIYGLFEGPVAQDHLLRTELKQQLDKRGATIMHQRLQLADPVSAARIHPNDTTRLIRALEVFQLTQRPLSHWQAQHRFADCLFDTVQIGLFRDRLELYQRIDQRVDAMVHKGLPKEVQTLLDRGYGPELKSMQSIGYRQTVDFLLGRSDWQTSVDLIKRDSRRYAKRQFTWFRKTPNIRWVVPEEIDTLLPALEAFLG